MRKKFYFKLISMLIAITMLLSGMVVPSFAETTLTGLYDGSDISALSYSTSNSTNISSVKGVKGKSDSDSVYAFTTNDPLATDEKSTIQPLEVNNDYKPLVYEFQFMMPQGSSGFNLWAQFWPVSGSTDQNTMTITPDGLNPGGHTAESNCIIPDTLFEYEKWYTVAIAFPGASTELEYGTHLGVYINGVHKANIAYGGGSNNYNKSKGLRRFRMSPISGTAGTVYAYFDNLRMVDSVYDSSMDTMPEISVSNKEKVYSIENKVINFAAGITVSDLKSSLSRLSDTNIRVYNKKGVLQLDTAYVPHGGTLVAAACNSTGTERTYDYYTLSETSSGVNIYGELDFSARSPKLNLDIQTQNTSGGTVWIAIYQDSTLEKLLAKTCANGVSALELGLDVTKEEFIENYEVKCFAWDNNNNPLSTVADIRMSDKLILADYTTEAACENAGFEYSDTYKIFGKGAMKYDIDTLNEKDLSITISKKDWSGYNTLNIEMYSAKYTGESIHFAARSENDQTQGDDYFNFYPAIDFEGKWVTSSFSFDYDNPGESYGFAKTRNPVGFNKIDKLSLWSNYTGTSELSSDTEIYISRIYLTNESKLYKDSIKNLNYYSFSDLIKDISNGAHPRIVTDRANLQNNLYLIENGEVEFLNNTASDVIALAEAALNTPDSQYGLYDGVRLVRTEREMIRNLSVAYVITGKPEYLNRCVQAINVMASWPDWNPGHYLDVAEAAYSFALAYDLLYDELGDNRETIEQALMSHAIEPALKIWETDSGVAAHTDNWQCVSAGGIGMAALVICDSVSEDDAFICNQFISHAIRTLPRGIKQFAPDGAYDEGLGYWSYATEYLFGFIMTLNNSVGNDYDLTDLSGLEQTGYFPITALGPAGNFNFYDSDYSANATSRAPQMFTIAHIYNQPDLAAYAATANESGDYLDIISYRHELAQLGGDYTESMPKDHRFTGTQHLVYTRSGWDDDATYVAYKGGKNNATSHGDLDIGQFVMDSQGVRWFHDLGAEDYNADGIWNTDAPSADTITRWSYYRKRAEGHNTLVINPDSSVDQRINATATIDTFASQEGASYGIIDMTEAYADDVTSARRGIALLNNRQDVLIQDEIVSNGLLGDIYSFFHTKATITIDEHNPAIAYLEQNGKKIRLDIISDGAVWDMMDAEPLVLTNPKDALSNHLYKKLFIHLENVQSPTISVLIRNITDSSADVPTEIKPIPLSQWNTYLN